MKPALLRFFLEDFEPARGPGLVRGLGDEVCGVLHGPGDQVLLFLDEGLVVEVEVDAGAADEERVEVGDLGELGVGIWNEDSRIREFENSLLYICQHIP